MEWTSICKYTERIHKHTTTKQKQNRFCSKWIYFLQVSKPAYTHETTMSVMTKTMAYSAALNQKREKITLAPLDTSCLKDTVRSFMDTDKLWGDLLYDEGYENAKSQKYDDWKEIIEDVILLPGCTIASHEEAIAIFKQAQSEGYSALLLELRNKHRNEWYSEWNAVLQTKEKVMKPCKYYCHDGILGNPTPASGRWEAGCQHYNKDGDCQYIHPDEHEWEHACKLHTMKTHRKRY